MFPRLRKRSPQGSSESASDKEDDEATDYVFRIIYPGTQAELGECVGRECCGWVITRWMSEQGHGGHTVHVAPGSSSGGAGFARSI